MNISTDGESMWDQDFKIGLWSQREEKEGEPATALAQGPEADPRAKPWDDQPGRACGVTDRRR